MANNPENTGEIFSSEAGTGIKRLIQKVNEDFLFRLDPILGPIRDMNKSYLNQIKNDYRRLSYEKLSNTSVTSTL